MKQNALVRDSKKRVMIVDDVADIRLMLRYIIEKENYVIVAEAANGLEAVEKYREHRPDITIMDIDMPFKTGVEAAEEIRAFADSARIIFCSGGVSRFEPVQIGAEAQSVVRKPFLPAQLYQAMSS
jgi:two-component system, chemotaxis family, chemotaxis protein CheY